MKSILAVAVLLLTANGAANACSCIRESEDRKIALSERLERSHLVFLGRIESTQDLTVSDDGYETQYQRTQFYILQSWKGEKSSRVYVQTALECCMCEYRFPTSGVFLVFAYGPNKDGTYETSACDQPRVLERAQEDIALLDKVATRIAEQAVPADRARNARPLNGDVRHWRT